MKLPHRACRYVSNLWCDEKAAHSIVKVIVETVAQLISIIAQVFYLINIAEYLTHKKHVFARRMLFPTKQSPDL